MEVKILDGANMDIDLVSGESTSWKQSPCPWNQVDGINSHKCAVKNISICKYFCGVQYMDNVICCYPDKNISVDNKQNI